MGTRDKFPSPFPLYHEETPFPENSDISPAEQRKNLSLFLTPLLFVNELNYLILEAEFNFVDNFQGKEIKRESGEKWILPGPNYYLPSDDTKIISEMKCEIVKENEALIEAIRNFKDKNNIVR